MKHRVILIITLILLGLTASVCFADEVTVDPSKVIKEASPLGYGKDWTGAYSYLSDNTESSSMSNKLSNGLKQNHATIPLIRMGGDSSNSFYWKGKLGSINERYGSNYVKNEGYLDYYLNFKKIDPSLQLLVVINLNDTDDNNMDLVRFLTLNPDDANAIGSDGTNWAQKRVDLGQIEPVTVYAFELGNELYPKSDLSDDFALSEAQDYTQKCAHLIPLLRSVNADIKIAPIMNSMAMISYLDSNGTSAEKRCRNWNKTVIESLKNDIDYVVHHDYFGSSSTSRVALNKRDTYYNVMEDYLKGTNIGIILSETGYYTSGVEMSSSVGTLPNTNVLGLGFGVGRFYIKAYSMPRVRAIIHYGFLGDEQNGKEGSEWWMSYRLCFDDVYRTSASGMIAELFAKESNAKPISTAVSYSSFYNRTINIMAQAFLESNGDITLIMIPDATKENKTNTANIKISGYTPVTKTVLQGKGYTADNTSSTPYGFMQSFSKQTSTSVSIPAYSIVAVRFVPNGTSFTPSQLGEIEVRQNSSKLDVYDKLYDGHGFTNGQMLGAVLVDATVDENNYCDDDVIAIAFTKLNSNKLYFDIPLPYNLKTGTYKVIIGNDSKTHSKTFTYTSPISTTFDVSVNGCNVSINAYSNDNAIGKLPITVMYGDNASFDSVVSQSYKLAYTGELVFNDGIGHVEFAMPNDVLNGIYTVILGSGSAAIYKTFTYTATNDKYMITKVPFDANDVDVPNYSVNGKICVEVKNLTNTPVSAHMLIAYYNNDRFVGVNLSTNKDILPNSTEIFSVDGNYPGADIAKVLVWDSQCNTPYTRTYNLK